MRPIIVKSSSFKIRCANVTVRSSIKGHFSVVVVISGVHLNFSASIVNAPRITDKLFESNLTFCIVSVD
jgi:hypothetical protein